MAMESFPFNWPEAADFGHALLPYHPPVLVHTFRVRVEIVLCIASKKLQQIHPFRKKELFQGRIHPGRLA